MSSNHSRYHLRGLHPSLWLGTTSDRYAAWIGQIYPDDYSESVSSRKRTLAGESYTETTVPVESVSHYFQHFDALELDFTFYRPLLDNGQPTRTLFTLQRYAEHLPPHARILVKAPQAFVAPALGHGARRTSNPGYLDADAYLRDFLTPLAQTLQHHLVGVIVEQEYRRKGDSPSAEAFVEEIRPFVDALAGNGTQHHLEVRSQHFLQRPYFEFLAERGLGQVLSHWTWLPPLAEQLERAGTRFYAADGNVVVRLLTPRNTRYADAYAQAYPFDAPVPELVTASQTGQMIADTARVAALAHEAGARAIVLANNRAYGNAPDLAVRIADAALDALPPP